MRLLLEILVFIHQMWNGYLLEIYLIRDIKWYVTAVRLHQGAAQLSVQCAPLF